ncbi:MAG: peptidoglycan DD-metalloendopeptidase family protein [Lachnospiraceae bacterium]|nr:peptidoglycan DD-metalloendopeptidase family protein [Lachnospiraceae bacterium]
MKKIKLKTRMQWGWFKAALIGACLGLLIAPAVDSSLGITNIAFDNGQDEEVEKGNTASKENPVRSFFENISFGPKVKVIINGDVVALAKTKEEGEAAFKAARLAYNAEGVRILDVNAGFEEVDKEKDADTVKGMKVLKDEALTEVILASFDSCADKERELAYTMRIDDYTVTVDSMENLVAVLEKAQGQYDNEDQFQVNLVAPESRNVTMYEVGITSNNLDDASQDNGNEQQADQKEGDTGDEDDNRDDESGEEDGRSEDKGSDSKADDKVTAQAENDGVKYIGFSDKIQVMQTYVDKSQIKNEKTAYEEITRQKDEPGIYVVKPGDYLDLIAEKNNMTVEQIKELNPGIESDENLFYDDRLNVMVQTAAVQILVKKQETYEEKYYEDVVYEDDENMFIGETEVIQEGSEGTHIVTDLVTYKNDVESDREQLEENVTVAAVAQIVRRGTKSKPTYMYPVTNWNVTSNFGYRWGRLHAGTDVGVPVGTTVRASRAGQVITAGWVGGYGNCVMIDHGDGVWTVYGHLSEFTTTVGSYVNQGDQIALSGNTGRSTGPHLHFEIRVNGSAVDAIPYLTGTAN